MNPEQLIAAAEAILRDAENNLAGCVASLTQHGARNGGVPNAEVVELVSAQAKVGQLCAVIALAKLAVSETKADAK